ncbi:hypothetical protein CMI42_06305 [Candidatus Pacearchaeota archaeon]|nr:hypothetical protein [Candidatus Pacearchaeota archaeon]
MQVTLIPRDDYSFYEWTPQPNTELSVISKEYGIVIKHRDEEPILRDMAGYVITQIQLDYKE